MKSRALSKKRAARSQNSLYAIDTANAQAPSDPDAAKETSRRDWANKVSKAVSFLCQAVRGRLAAYRPPRRMRLCETLSLGDKRFLAIVTVDQQQFLLSACANSIGVLAQVSQPTSFQQIVQQCCDQGTGEQQ